MIAEFFATLLGRRRRSPGPPPAQARPPSAQPATPATAPPTLVEMLHSLVEDLGGPQLEIERDAWLTLADRVTRLAAAMPPPPSFPRIATQLLVLARDPDVDLNELVGLVQRDAAIASTLVRMANSPAFAPAVPIATLRGAIHSLGSARVVELAVGSAGRSYYDVASAIELALFPALWQGMFHDAMANGFSAGRLALDIPGSRGDSALFAGLLADVGRPIALRILGGLVRDGLEAPSDAIVLAMLDEVAAAIGGQAVRAMQLPDELRAACIPDPEHATPDALIARLVASIGAIQRRSPRIWDNAGDVRRCAEQLKLGPYVIRSLFAQRAQHALEAAQLFAAA